jgi:hypothetical protein
MSSNENSIAMARLPEIPDNPPPLWLFRNTDKPRRDFREIWNRRKKGHYIYRCIDSHECFLLVSLRSFPCYPYCEHTMFDALLDLLPHELHPERSDPISAITALINQRKEGKFWWICGECGNLKPCETTVYYHTKCENICGGVMYDLIVEILHLDIKDQNDWLFRQLLQLKTTLKDLRAEIPLVMFTEDMLQWWIGTVDNVDHQADEILFQIQQNKDRNWSGLLFELSHTLALLVTRGNWVRTFRGSVIRVTHAEEVIENIWRTVFEGGENCPSDVPN